MTEPLKLVEHQRDEEPTAQEPEDGTRSRPEGVPSNAVYARVGDEVLQAARDGVRRNLPPNDIVREIKAAHGVHLSVGELRLLLASRRIPGPVQGR